MKEKNIWALFLDPNFERKGIGQLLHRTMLDWYFEQTKDNVWLGTRINTRAEKFYKIAGWNEIGNHGINEIKFEMTETGFNFEKVIEVEETDKMTQATKRGDVERDQIIQYITDHGSATLNELHAAIGESWRIQHYLRILTNEDNILVKEGRGSTAAWKLINQ